MAAPYAMRGREVRDRNQHFPSCPEATNARPISLGEAGCSCLNASRLPPPPPRSVLPKPPPGEGKTDGSRIVEQLERVADSLQSIDDILRRMYDRGA